MSTDEAITSLFDAFEATDVETDQLAIVRKIRHLILPLPQAEGREDDASSTAAFALQRETLECLVMFLSPLTLSSNEHLLCEVADTFAITLQEVIRSVFDDLTSDSSASLFREADAVRQTLLSLGRDGMTVAVQLRVVYLAASILSSPFADRMAELAKAQQQQHTTGIGHLFVQADQ